MIEITTRCDTPNMEGAFKLLDNPEQSPKSEHVTGVFSRETGKLLKVLPKDSAESIKYLKDTRNYLLRYLLLRR